MGREATGKQRRADEMCRQPRMDKDVSMAGQRACSGKGTLLWLGKERFWQGVGVSPSPCPGSGARCASTQSPSAARPCGCCGTERRALIALVEKVETGTMPAPQVSWV